MTANSQLVFNRLKGHGATPTICLPGFVPKSREAFHRQIGLLRVFGDVLLVDYPDDTFHLESSLDQLAEAADSLTSGSHPPVIVSVSFGSALAVQLLKRKPQLPLGGFILVSPMLTLRDIYGNDHDTTFFGKLARTIVQADTFGEELEASVAKAKKVFGRLLRAGQSMEIADVPQPVLDEVHRALQGVEDKAVLERLKIICELEDLCRESTVTTAPTLILWAEAEQDVIRKGSDNYRLLSGQPGKAFPLGKSVVVKSGNPDKPLKHASLLAHAHCYNEHLKEFFVEQKKSVC